MIPGRVMFLGERRNPFFCLCQLPPLTLLGEVSLIFQMVIMRLEITGIHTNESCTSLLTNVGSPEGVLILVNYSLYFLPCNCRVDVNVDSQVLLDTWCRGENRILSFHLQPRDCSQGEGSYNAVPPVVEW